MNENTIADPIRLAVIVGSVREGRLAPYVADWFIERATRHGRFVVDVIDLLDVDLPMAMPDFERPMSPEVQNVLASVIPSLERADAFVGVVTEYNHGPTAVLKNFIDWHRTEWQAKPVGFVSYGGMSGGLRAVEQLRQIFAELRAVTIRDTVSLHRPWDRLGPGRPSRDMTDSDLAVKTMLDDLDWWATTLRDARRVRPYQP